METFFLAETVKYLYLLQDPDTEVDILHKVIKDMVLVACLWHGYFVLWTFPLTMQCSIFPACIQYRSSSHENVQRS